MYLTILFSIFFSVVFFFQLGNRFESSVKLHKVWGWSKTLDMGMKEAELAANPFKILNGYATANDLFFFKSEKTPKAPPYLYEVPPLGNGFFQYEQAGKEVSFYSPNREILWKKETNSYPKSDAKGELVLFTSGDNNQVFLTDGSGNQLRTVSGRFLTDFAVNNQQDSVVVFSGGELYKLDKTGKPLFTTVIVPSEENSLLFIKSAAIANDGKCLAVHFLDKDRDIVRVYEEDDEKYSFELSRQYPHKIYMAVGDNCGVALNLSDRLLLLNKRGKVVIDREKKPETIYQPVLAFGRYFLVSVGDKMLAYDYNGNLTAHETVQDGPWRIFTSGKKDFFIETQKEIFQFAVKP